MDVQCLSGQGSDPEEKLYDQRGETELEIYNLTRSRARNVRRDKIVVH